MRHTRLTALLLSGLLVGFRQIAEKKIIGVFLIGDSTVADYTIYDDYTTRRYPITGWGQVFQAFMSHDSLVKVRNIIKADSVLVIDNARGGRSTRTFFEEGRWASVYQSLKPNDLVLIQFGHNMNFPTGSFEAYPTGQNDNTHFQPERAAEVARMVFEALQGI